MKQSMWNWEASTEKELIEHLHKIPCDIPARGHGRTKEHTERWILRRMLATVSKVSLLNYPVALEKTERPDLILRTKKGTIGIEVTEAVPSSYAQALSVRNKHFPGAIIDISLFKWGSAPRSGKEIRAMLKACTQDLMGPGWIGDSVEKEWAEAIAAAVGTKARKLNEPDFRRQDNNWLAIYDNVPGPGLQLELAVAKLEAILSANTYKTGATFDLVTVESSDNLLLLPSSRILSVVRP